MPRKSWPVAGQCLTCGGEQHQYGLKFFGLICEAFKRAHDPQSMDAVEEMIAARQAFLFSVRPRACLTCYRLIAGVLPAGERLLHRRKRREWLLSGKPPTAWKPTPRQLKKIEKNKEKYRKELAKARKKRRKRKLLTAEQRSV
jgi:hypothetical protein